MISNKLQFGMMMLVCSGLCMEAAGESTRVACVGDSITFGHGIVDRKNNSYPSQLGRWLGRDYVVGNFGVSGTTLLSSADRPYVRTSVYTNALAFRPDVVVINLGANDSKHPGDGSLDAEKAIDNWRFGTNYTRDYRALIASFRQANPAVKVYVCLPTPSFPGRWGINDRTVREEMIPMIRQVAAETESEVIDLYAALSGRSELFPDTVHPNAEGARLMAVAVYTALTGHALATEGLESPSPAVEQLTAP